MSKKRMSGSSIFPLETNRISCDSRTTSNGNFTLHLDRHVPQSCFKRLARTARQYIRQRPRLKKFFNDTALWLKKTALWAVRLVTSPNSLKHCASATGKACRKMVWARDEAVLFCRSSERIAGTFHAHISPKASAAYASFRSNIRNF